MRRPRPFGLFVICGLVAAVLAPSAQAHSISLRDLLRGPHPTWPRRPADPPVAAYSPDDGDRFILDRSASPPLLRFETSPEIWVLQPHPGPRGDTIYRNDLGEAVLRATRLGGLTLFTRERPDGTAAALEGEAAPIRPSAIFSVIALQQHLAQASVRASHAMQRLVVFEAPDVTPESATMVADAGQVAAEAIISFGKHPNPHKPPLKLDKVVLTPGRQPVATLKDGVLDIVFSPGAGLAGRPSSRRIAAALGR